MTSTSFNSPPGRGQPSGDHPLAQLSAEDLNLITAFVLASGSLKALAKTYGVSYPTIRNRLDELIRRVQAAVDGQPADPVAEVLAGLVERGELTGRGARSILEAVHAQRGATPPGPNSAPRAASSEGGHR